MVLGSCYAWGEGHSAGRRCGNSVRQRVKLGAWHLLEVPGRSGLGKTGGARAVWAWPRHLAIQVAGSPAYSVAVDREQGNRERREERDESVAISKFSRSSNQFCKLHFPPSSWPQMKTFEYHFCSVFRDQLLF